MSSHLMSSWQRRENVQIPDCCVLAGATCPSGPQWSQECDVTRGESSLVSHHKPIELIVRRNAASSHYTNNTASIYSHCVLQLFEGETQLELLLVSSENNFVLMRRKGERSNISNTEVRTSYLSEENTDKILCGPGRLSMLHLPLWLSWPADPAGRVTRRARC